MSITEKEATGPLPTAELIELACKLGPWRGRDSSNYPTPTIAGSKQDQVTPDGIENPLWEILRHIPGTTSWHGGRIEPDGFHASMQPEFNQIGRFELATRFSWSIPSPGDMLWLTKVLDGQGVVEIGAGSGYWAWQMTQVGIDVIAFDPHEPGPDNRYVKHGPYHPVQLGDDTEAANYPERALMLCWPPYCDPVAIEALKVYTGDLLIYIGEGNGGCCADDDFFKLLDAEWSEIEESPFHVTWSGIHCYMTAYQRKAAAS